MILFLFFACSGANTPSVEQLQEELQAAEKTIEGLREQLATQERRIANVARLDEAMEAAHTRVEARCSEVAGRSAEHSQTFGLGKAGWEELTGDSELVLTQGRWIPHGPLEEPSGWRLVRLSRGGLYDSCGLRSADVLVSVNDILLVEPDGPQRAMASVIEDEEARLEILRGRKPLSLVIQRSVGG